MARRIKTQTQDDESTASASGEQSKAPGGPLPWPSSLRCPHCQELQLSDKLKDLPGGAKACQRCGAALSHLNGPAAGAPVSAPSTPAPAPRKDEPRPGGDSRFTTPSSPVSFAVSPLDVGETVTATWGEELYTPQQFFAFRVGPFMRSTKIREGETAVDAKRRIEAELEEMARIERTKKMSIFLDTMQQLFGEVKKRGAA